MKETKQEGRGGKERLTEEEDRMKTVLVTWDSLGCPQIPTTLTIL